MTIQIKPEGGVAVNATGAQIVQIKSDLALNLVANIAPSDLPISLAQEAVNVAQDTYNTDTTTVLVNKTNIGHAHAITSVTGLRAELDGLAASAGSGGAAVPLATAYATSIPLDITGAGRRMARTTLAANSEFTVAASPVEGGVCELVLVANGVNAPDLSAFVNGNSFAYATANGARNFYTFTYLDGTPILFGLALPVVDTEAPTIVSVAVNDASPSVVVFTFNELIDAAFVPAAANFTISGHTPTGTVTVSGTTVSVPVTAPFVNGEAARTAAYTPGTTKLRDLVGNLAVAFSGQAITNNVAVVTTPYTFVSSNGNSNTSGTPAMSYTLTTSVVVGRRVVVSVRTASNAVVTGVSDTGGNIYTQVGVSLKRDANTHYLFTTIATVAASSITATASASVGPIRVYAAHYTGLGGAVQAVVPKTNFTAADPATPAFGVEVYSEYFTPTNKPGALIGFADSYSNDFMEEGIGFTGRVEMSSGNLAGTRNEYEDKRLLTQDVERVVWRTTPNATSTRVYVVLGCYILEA